MTNLERALALAALELPVFPVRVGSDNTKTPLTKNGHLDASLDPGLIDDWWVKTPQAGVGVYVGKGGVVALDVDTKNGKDGWDSLERSWLEIPATFGYDTPSGGRHLIYAAPEGVPLAPTTNYRGMVGVDTRGGSSWVLWNGDVPKTRDAFTLAPVWLLDTTNLRSSDEFQGEVEEWFKSLVPGSPNALVRKAISRINSDMGHADMVSATFEAIRLGAEGNPGVPTLLSALEEAWLARDPGGHTTPVDRWEYKFHEALTSGIEKYGAAIQLLSELPLYSLALVPATVPDRLVTGTPGDKESFRELLAALLPLVSDDTVITSILWNSARTKDISHEWGLQFVADRVASARVRPEPVRENPTLSVNPENLVPEKAERAENGTVVSKTFLSKAELEKVTAVETFIDTYVAASATKGFQNNTYDIPSAWTALSMAFGMKAYVPKGINIGMNLWFMVLGYASTGKTTSDEFLTEVLDAILNGGDSYYNLGANSSPEGLHEELLVRDGMPSMIHHDEASDFFEDIRKKDWMSTLKDKFAKWYTGRVDPSNKVRLKELKGKSAKTSFNIHMLATPDRLTGLIDTAMFHSGFLARFNWLWGEPPVDDDGKYEATISEVGAKGVNPAVFALSADLAHGGWAIGVDPVAISVTTSARKRLEKAFKEFDTIARKHEKYDALEPAVTRMGRETLFKCASLLALYDGRTEIVLEDALVALRYVEEWFWVLQRVVETTSEGEFSRDTNEIEAYVKAEGDSVSEAKLNHRFRAMIRFSPRELSDRIDFLVKSGRLNIEEKNSRRMYHLNGRAD